MTDEQAAGTYDPSRFETTNLQDALEIILTPNDKDVITTQQRWETETPYLINLIEENVTLNSESVVVDFGCGLGRLSKELIHKYNCKVFGVDISKSMRAMSIGYVNHSNYVPISPETFEWLSLGADLCLSVWALQHVLLPYDALKTIHNNLRPAGKFFLVNENKRFVPTNIKVMNGTPGLEWTSENKPVWIDDHVDIFKASAELFRYPLKDGTLDPVIVGKELSERSYYALFNK